MQHVCAWGTATCAGASGACGWKGGCDGGNDDARGAGGCEHNLLGDSYHDAIGLVKYRVWQHVGVSARSWKGNGRRGEWYSTYESCLVLNANCVMEEGGWNTIDVVVDWVGIWEDEGVSPAEEQSYVTERYLSNRGLSAIRRPVPHLFFYVCLYLEYRIDLTRPQLNVGMSFLGQGSRLFHASRSLAGKSYGTRGCPSPPDLRSLSKCTEHLARQDTSKLSPD